MIDLTKVETASDIALKKALKVIHGLNKNIGYDRSDIIKAIKISKSQWEHYSLNKPLEKYSRKVNGRTYYFNPKYL